jgi:molecular chaperone IbpA
MQWAGANRACKTQSPGLPRRALKHCFKENVTMFDYTPLYRSSIGFDRLFRLLDEAQSVETQSYPPYNIERLSENAYRITMAVAGFADHELSIEAKGNALTVTGKKAHKPEAVTEYLHQGIAGRSFERRFQLADYVEVKGADLDHGLLHISLVREVPEALKPRQIAIGSTAQPKVLEAKAA